MIPASRSIAPVRDAAKPMPWVSELAALYESGVTIRKGQLIMVAGQPGSGKSLWVQWLCHQWKSTCLYVSMDMSQSDTITRLGALCTGWTDQKIKAAFEEDGADSAYVEYKLESSVMDFVYDDAPTLGDVEKQLLAYDEMYGELPEVLVLDNLIDLDHESEDDYRAWNQTLLWLKGLCRETGVTVIVIHHARELDKTDYPSARKDFAGKVAKTPELMFSVALTPRSQFRVAVVKNRTGPCDAMARSGVEFESDPARVRFRHVGRWVKPERGS